MPYTKEQIAQNAEYFRLRLQATKQLNDVKKWAAHEGPDDMVLVDVRGRDAFRTAHVKGAACVPIDEMAALASKLPADRELVTFCWNHL